MIPGSTDARILSRQRTQLMGLAVATVMLFHSRFEFPSALWALPLRMGQSLGFSGVDVFFLLSGMGLAWSASGSGYRPGQFLSRRLARLVPTWWVVVAAFLSIRGIQGAPLALDSWLSRLAGLDFFRDGSFTFWFPPSMIATYLLFLAIWPAMRRTQHPFALAGALSLASWAVGAWLSLANAQLHLLILTMRLPIFFVGVAIGLETAPGRPSFRIGNVLLLLSAFAGLAALFLFRKGLPAADAWRWGTVWAPFFLLALPASMGSASLLERFEGRLPRLRSLLLWMGDRSLELYLVHLLAVETLWATLSRIQNPIPGFADLLCLALAFAAAPFLKRLASWPNRPKPSDPRRGGLSQPSSSTLRT